MRPCWEIEMEGNFENCLKITLPFEGGYVNHPKDPGGPTNKGITQRTLSAYLGRPASVNDVKNISDQTVKAIYKNQYWDKVWADRLPKGVDLAVFDYAVNSGVSRAVKDLQRTIGCRADGVMGLLTIEKLEEWMTTHGDEELVVAYCTRRYNFLKALRTWKTFGTGWTRRVMGNRVGAQENDVGIIDYAYKMANDEELPPLPVVEVNPGKANPEDIKATALMSKPELGGPALVAGGTVGEGLNSAANAIMPFSDISMAIKIVMISLIVAGASATGYGLWKKYKKGEVNL